MSFPKGVELGNVELARQNALELVGHDTVKLGERTAGVQIAISYLLGCSHTTSDILRRRGVGDDERVVARSAVLSALATSGRLRRLPARVAMRLLTSEERSLGRVSFVSVGSGRKRRGVPCALAS